MTLNSPKFPFIIPDLPEASRWISIYEEAFNTRIFSNFGPISRRLETALAQRYAHPGYEAVACCSATQGLLAALLAFFRGGQNIALPNFTFAATYQAIRLAGLNPIPIDIDPDTLEISLESLADAMSKVPIGGVVPVRPFGLVRDQSPIVAFCRKHGLPVIVDAAAGLGAASLPKFGSVNGEVEVFSLHATKSFSIGEGGVIFAPSDTAQAIRKKLNFGFEKDRTYSLGTNGKMDELHAAIALSQLERIDGIQEVREAHARRYDRFFHSVADVQLPAPAFKGSGWTMYPAIFKQLPADVVIATALEAGIETRRYYWPTVSTAAREPIDCPVSLEISSRISNQIVCFPIYSSNAQNLTDDLFEAIAKMFRQSNRFQ